MLEWIFLVLAVVINLTSNNVPNKFMVNSIRKRYCAMPYVGYNETVTDYCLTTIEYKSSGISASAIRNASSNTNNLIITDTGVPTPGKRAKLGPAILNDNGEIIKIDVLDGGYGYILTLYIKNDTSINNTAFLLPKLKYAYDGGIANINIINEGSGYINTDVENTLV